MLALTNYFSLRSERNCQVATQVSDGFAVASLGGSKLQEGENNEEDPADRRVVRLVYGKAS
jgi:hypothetical protein